jgi:hypothetical protein
MSAAGGRVGWVANGAAEAFLIFTNDESYDDMGWSVLRQRLRRRGAARLHLK